ncbi:unnamed protein product [Soboliphyme baturini]|uniref:Uncharacterized protein n=1 Tax=Soboliphyme baturini TaxID=241478 RepID=A0A183IJL8_9BILA|nr:unnamed protein product [Soboliphyme baturini]
MYRNRANACRWKQLLRQAALPQRKPAGRPAELTYRSSTDHPIRRNLLVLSCTLTTKLEHLWTCLTEFES